MIRIGAFVIACSLLVHSALAQDLTTKQQDILRTALATDGWLTEPMHGEFWSAVPTAIRSDAKAVAALVSYLNQMSAVALRFQRATWSSIKLSLAARRVIKTADYEATKAEMRSASQLLAYRASAEKGAQTADKMLEAAAVGRKMDSPNGPFFITEEMVDGVLAGLDGSLHRFRLLSNPTWSTAVEEYSFPNEHVRILWHGPFTRETQTVTIEDGRAVPVTLLSFRLSEQEHVAIGFMRLQGRWLDPQGASIRTVAATLGGIGIQDGRPTAGRWRGRVAAEGGGSARLSAGAIHASVRIVEAQENGGAWQIFAISSVSLADAILLRLRLEAASNFERTP